MNVLVLPLLLACVALGSGLEVPLTEQAEADLIKELPGLNFSVPYRQFSGFLDAGSNTFLHYWFVESEQDPATSPLLLWLNGGPGCSSLDGLLNELGPFHINNDGKTLYNNTYSWNTFANILYLESPACVGFSYNKDGNCSAGDDSTSQLNYNALKKFFEKFPEYRKNEFFVTGESYGGIYVPTLSLRIVENNDSFPINFQGFAVGNGLSSFKLNDNSIIFFANYHGLLGKILWDELVFHCCLGDSPTQENCNFADNIWPVCQDRVATASKIVYDSGLNMYNLYDNCVPPSNVLGVGSVNISNEIEVMGLSRYQADRRNVHRKNSMLAASARGALKLDPPCTSSKALSDYLNSGAVRSALHIPSTVQQWQVCNDEVNAKFQRQYTNMSEQYKKLHAAGVRALIYNGDVDMACNFIGDQWFVEGLNFKETAARRSWMSEGQVGGFLKRFELLDLVTVRGSGHMVPQDKPGPSLHMIRAFVLGLNY
ncbi:Peptidase S10 serine carboxypeptidase [Trinorchestia longiramus]|nr:Peptidase S10 serine carboxypeptidase [Trinorchestia longiramus]